MGEDTKIFEIMFDDLTEDAQKRLLEAFNTAPEEENWDIFPIAELVREPSE